MEELETVKSLINEALAKEGYELYSFKYMPRTKILEIVVDRDEPINIDNITEISLLISELLDEHDFTETAYTLDVSSLGIEKPIDVNRLDKYVGKYVNLHLANPYKGKNTLEGDLVEVKDDQVLLTYKDKTRDIKCELNKKDIDKARLAIKF